MPDSDRRHVNRRATALPVTLIIPADAIGGETVDVSPTGVLIEVKERLTVLLRFGDEKALRGHLVRATPTDDDKTAYAVQLDTVPTE